METLVSHVQEYGIRRTLRSNVSSLPVQSVTLGIVNQRAEGFGISAATYEDKFGLLRLAHAVASDPQLEGEPPICYTSICINYNYASILHVDKYNEGMSQIVAGGDFRGGECFVMQGVGM